jgi:hypothetical protein
LHSADDEHRPWFARFWLWFGLYAVVWVAVYGYLW